MNAEQIEISEAEKQLEPEVAGGRTSGSIVRKLARLKKDRQRAALGRLARRKGAEVILLAAKDDALAPEPIYW